MMAKSNPAITMRFMITPDHHFPRHLIWGGGFLSSATNYSGLSNDARQHDIQTIWPYGSDTNTKPVHESARLFVKSHCEVGNRTGRTPDWGAHSKGVLDALLAVLTLKQYGLPLPGHIHLVSGPWDGPSNRSFEFVMKSLFDDPGISQEEKREILAIVASRTTNVTTYSCVGDWIVRPEEAQLPEAENVELKVLRGDGKTPAAQERRASQNHSGLPFGVKETIFKYVLEPRKRMEFRRAA